MCWLVGLLVLGLAVGCGRPEPPPGDARLRPLTGPQLQRLVRENGPQVTVVNLWATWCGPCREEFPALVRLQRDWQDQGVQVLLVSTDQHSELPRVKAFLAEQQVGFPSYWKAEPDREFLAGLGVSWAGALPATVVYDGQGQVRDFWQGLADYGRFTNAVGRVLGNR